MGRHLIAFMPDPGMDWKFSPTDGGAVADGAEVVSRERGDSITVIVPSTEVSVHRIRLPGGRQADILQAARFEVEEEVSVPVEALHVSVEKAGDGGAYDVCLVSHAIMRSWVDRLKQVGLDHARIVPDVTMVPDDSPALDLGDRILVVQDGRRLAIDKRLPGAVTNALIEDGDGQAVPVERPLQLFSGFAGDGHVGLDLRQAQYARRTESPMAFRRFKVPLGLAAALFVAWTGYTAAQVQAAKQLKTALDRQSAALYSSAFPNEAVPANLLASVRERIGADDMRPADFRQMAAVMYDALSDASSTALSNLRFDADTGQMRVTLIYSAFGDDQALKSNLERNGFDVRLGEARVENGLVIGDLTLEWAS